MTTVTIAAASPATKTKHQSIGALKAGELGEGDGYHSLSPTTEEEISIADQLLISSSGSTSRASSLSTRTSSGASGAADFDLLAAHSQSYNKSSSPTCFSPNTTNLVTTTMTNNSRRQHMANDAGGGVISSQRPPASKSPILIKYNYYDYNGSRQEQTNHDMNYQQHLLNAAGIQRNLSPTFKQSLDQIVRNSQQLQKLTLQQQQVNNHKNSNNNNNNNNSPPCLPDQEQQQHLAAIHFSRRYKLSSYEQRCVRCKKTVYQMDKVGPLKDFTFYHQNCFKCRECGTKLTLKTYFNNQQSSNDYEVYCHRHCPKTGPGRLDNQSVGIRCALNAPKVFDINQHLPQAIGGGGLFGSQANDAFAAAHQTHDQTQWSAAQINNYIIGDHNSHSSNNLASPQVDSSAMYIQHAVQQTRLQNIYKNSQVDKKISQFINKRLEYLEPKQKLLEMRHREEEDALFKTFEQKWRQEESCISEQIREEWEIELSKLLEKYKRQLSNISTTTTTTSSTNNQQQHQQQQAQLVKLNDDRKMKNLLLKQLSEGTELSKEQMIEFERMNLEKTMTIKLDRKKETLKRKLKEFERQATAELVEKQSREMLALISIKLDEFKEEQKRKIGSDLEQFEAIESLANQLGSSLQFSALKSNGKLTAGAKEGMDSGVLEHNSQSSSHNILSPNNNYHAQQPQVMRAGTNTNSTTGAVNQKQTLLVDTPSPKAPKVSKMELYNNEEPDEVFRDIDELAINVAKEDQQTFTDLVHHLTRHCLTDIEKARAIFRWITVKNLNTMQFDNSIKPDTPLGLLRGIKNGSESYHVLFKRLCSYAGLHCVVIKGFSKSAGYQPGVKFEGNRFRNSWNAVYVAGAWRFVQCNWGARHLVSVAVMQDKNQAAENKSPRLAPKTNSSSTATAVGATRPLAVQSSASTLASHTPTTATTNSPITTTNPNQQKHLLLQQAASHHHHHQLHNQPAPAAHNPVHGRRALAAAAAAAGSMVPPLPTLINGRQQEINTNNNTFIDKQQQQQKHKQQQRSHHKNSLASPSFSSSSTVSHSNSTSSSSSSPHSSAAQHHRHHHHQHHHHHHSPPSGILSGSSGSSPFSHQANPTNQVLDHHRQQRSGVGAGKLSSTTTSSSSAHNNTNSNSNNTSDSLRYEYDDHYFLTDPDEFIYEFLPLNPEWQLLKSRPISLEEFENLPFVRSLFFKYGLYFPQNDIRSVLYTDSSGATTIKIGMPTHMIPSLIFHYNLKYFNSDLEHYDEVNLKRFVMQSVESGSSSGGSSSANPSSPSPNGAGGNDYHQHSNNNNNNNYQSSGSATNGMQQKVLLSNIVTFRVHLPENGSYILDIFANSTTPTQYITGEPMKFKSVCKFKIIAKNLKTVMIPLPDCASGEYGPMKATRLFGIIPLTHESGLISVHNDQRFLEIQFRMTRPLLDFMASLHKNGYDERQLSKSIKIFIDGDIVFVTVKFFEDGQYGLDIYTRDQTICGDSIRDDGSDLKPKNLTASNNLSNNEPKKQLLTHCCKYLINVRTKSANNNNNNKHNNRL